MDNIDLIRKALFTPCKTKEELDRWIRVFLQIRFPNKIVSDESNSCPLEMIWQLYDHAVRNDTEGWKRSMSYANRFGGKCVKKGTLLRTPLGLRPIENVKVGETIWSGKAWRTVTDWVHDGEKDSATVELEFGQLLTGSLQHRVWAWEPGKMPDWKHIKDLSANDLVAVDTSIPAQRIDTPDYDLGYFLGILQGDGCLRFMDDGHITFTTNNAKLLEYWTLQCLKYAGRAPKKSSSRPYDFRVNSVKLCSFLREQGLTPSYSWEKRIPNSVLENYSKTLGFIAGILDTDGTVSVSGKVQIHMTATGLVEQLQIALASVGIDSQLIRRNDLVGLQKHPVWKLNISTRETYKLSELLRNLCLTEKLDRARYVKFSQSGIPHSHLIHLLSKLDTKGGKRKRTSRKPATGKAYGVVSEDKVRKLIDHGVSTNQLSATTIELWDDTLKYRWHRVKKVTFGMADFFDLTVDVDHSYWSDGVVSHNTLGASVLETVLLLHTDRNIIHMAAIVDQSKKAQEYVKGFFEKPYLRDFKRADNASQTSIVANIHEKTGIPVTVEEFDSLSESQKLEYRHKENYVRIIACTMQASNGQHGELFIVDEVDVIQKQNLRAYDQAKGGIPTSRNGMIAMTLFTSTRKSRIGKVQAEIDEAPKTGLRLNHWNIIDITEPCSTDRHKPEEPKQTYWINDADLKHITDGEYEAVTETEKHKWYSREGYAGCAKCPLFAACKGRLATEQEGYSGKYEEGGTALLLPIPDVIDLFKSATSEFITTEYLCRKPDTSGLVYPRFNEEIHRKTASQIAEMVHGAPVPDVNTKHELIDYLVKKGAMFAAGMDFGFNHLFAVVTFAVWGNWAFVIDVVAKAQQELDDKLAITEHLKDLHCSIYPDPEDPSSIVTFKRKGYRMKEWSKNAGSVRGGIDIVRTKMYSKALGATVFLLSDDPDIDLLAKHVKDYAYTIGIDGRFTETPNETNDDLPDAFRYGIMNVFGKNGGLKNINLGLTPVPEAEQEHWTKRVERHNAGAMNNMVRQLTGGMNSSFGSGGDETKNKGRVRRGSFFWDK